MRQKSGPEKQPAEDAIKDIRRATRRHFSAEEKIRVVLEGLRGRRASPTSVAARASPRQLMLPVRPFPRLARCDRGYWSTALHSGTTSNGAPWVAPKATCALP